MKGALGLAEIVEQIQGFSSFGFSGRRSASKAILDPVILTWPGRSSTGRTFTVLTVICSKASRFSISHLATPAISRCATASSHSTRAVLRQLLDLLREANSRSQSDCLEQLRRYIQ